MSCRRRERANDRGCSVGQLDATGCSPGCCHEPLDVYDPSYTRNTITSGRASNLGHPSLQRCIQYEHGSMRLALEMLDKHRDRCAGDPRRLQYILDAGQRAHHNDGLHNAAYRPKYVCWPCRRTFKPTVGKGKQAVHTALPGGNKHGIQETTRGQAYVPSLKDNLARIDERDASRIYTRHRSSDGRDQTVWAVRPASTKQTKRASDADKRLYEAYTSELNRRATQPLWSANRPQGTSVPMPDPNLPPGCTTEDEADEWLEATRARLPDELVPARIVVTCCPACAQPGTRIGSNFRAPPRDDVRAWAQAQRRTEEQGERWDFCLQGDQGAEAAFTELRQLARARYDVEHGPGGGEGEGEGDGAAAAPSSSSKQQARVSGRAKRREQELRAQLKLERCKIEVYKSHEVKSEWPRRAEPKRI